MLTTMLIAEKMQTKQNIAILNLTSNMKSLKQLKNRDIQLHLPVKTKYTDSRMRGQVQADNIQARARETLITNEAEAVNHLL